MRLLSPALLVLLTFALVPFPGQSPAPASHAKVVVTASSGAWTVYHHDNAHTGYDSSVPAMSGVTAGWVSPAMDGEVYAEPLIYNGVVYAATLKNTVYAFNQSTGALMWAKNVGTPQTGGWVCGNVGPSAGILGTPVIDQAANRIYVAALIAGAPPIYRLFGLDLANSGNIVLNTAVTPAGFDWKIQQQRGALALANGYVYVPYGGRAGDCFDNGTPYYGWVVGAQTSGVGTPNAFRTPSGAESVWSAGGVVVDDASGNVFFATGNAIPCAGSTMSDSIVRVTPTLATPAYFSPNDWQSNWCATDTDLGSASPVLISPTLMFTSGKYGGGFLLDPTNLGGVDGQIYPPKTPYAQAEACLGQHSDATFGSFAYAAAFVYVECETPSAGLGLVALNVNTSALSFTPCDATCPAPDWHTGGSTRFGPPIVAGGAVWAASDGGGLSAFNAATGAPMYQSAGFGINRFVTPAEAGGQVFVPSHTVIRSFNMSFLPWSSLGGVLTSGPDAGAASATQVNVFGRGTDNGLWQDSFNGTAWGGWQPLGGGLTSDPGAVSLSATRTDVFVRGTDGQMWHKQWNGTVWLGWEPLGGRLSSGPDASAWSGPTHIDVFVRGTDNQLWHKWSDGATWYPWEPLGGGLASDPGSVSWGPNRIDVFVRGTDNQLWHRWWDGSAWRGWEALGGGLRSGPDVASCASGHLDVFVIGTDGGLWQKSYNGSWSQWSPLGGTWTSAPSAVCRPGTTTVDLFERGQDQALWHVTVTGS